MASGGKREGAGRPKGAVNKATKDIREAAQEYTAEALAVLVDVMANGDSAAARVAAANSVLDRGHGKPKQAIVGGDEGDNPIRTEAVIDVGKLSDDQLRTLASIKVHGG